MQFFIIDKLGCQDLQPDLQSWDTIDTRKGPLMLIKSTIISIYVYISFIIY